MLSLVPHATVNCFIALALGNNRPVYNGKRYYTTGRSASNWLPGGDLVLCLGVCCIQLIPLLLYDVMIFRCPGYNDNGALLHSLLCVPPSALQAVLSGELLLGQEDHIGCGLHRGEFRVQSLG